MGRKLGSHEGYSGCIRVLALTCAQCILWRSVFACIYNVRIFQRCHVRLLVSLWLCLCLQNAKLGRPLNVLIPKFISLFLHANPTFRELSISGLTLRVPASLPVCLYACMPARLWVCVRWDPCGLCRRLEPLASLLGLASCRAWACRTH